MSNFKGIMRLTKADANHDAFEECIGAFCADIAELRLKPTLKIHIVDDHLSTFVKSKSSGFSLAAFSEQGMESCHCFHEQYSVSDVVEQRSHFVPGVRTAQGLAIFELMTILILYYNKKLSIISRPPEVRL